MARAPKINYGVPKSPWLDEMTSRCHVMVERGCKGFSFFLGSVKNTENRICDVVAKSMGPVNYTAPQYHASLLLPPVVHSLIS